MNKTAKERQEEKSKEIWVSVAPTAQQCKTCIFALKDTEYTVGAEKANCDIYKPPLSKPKGVLTDETKCDFRVGK